MANKHAIAGPRLTMREIVQKRILDEVVGSPAAGKWKVLIMDEETTKVVSAALTMFEIMEQNVSLVENLNLGRQSFPEMDAVYFISPTMESAKRVMGDFISQSRAAEMPPIDGKPQHPVCRYGSVHLIFTRSVGPEIIELFQSNPLLISKVKTFREVHLEFFAQEKYAYHLNMADALSRLYGKAANSSYPVTLGRKLASLCITLNEHPYIRYQASSAFTREIANTLHQTLLAYKRANPTFVVNGDDASLGWERGHLLILDRTFDPLTPLMHEYTYQSMANDLLDIDVRGMITYETNTEKGSVEKEAILNSEADELWKEHRHKHIAKVIAVIKERMDDILQTSAGAKLAREKGGDMDISTMAAAVKNLPEYTQTMSNLGRHVAITSKCMHAFTAQHLMDLSIVEQTLSTGVDEEGREVRGRAAMELTMEKLSNPRISKDLKVRLLAIFFVTQRPLSAEDRRQLMTAAKVTETDKQMFNNLELLMGPLDAAAQTAAAAAAASPKTGGGGGGGFFSRILGGRREAEKIPATVEGEYADTRHVSQLKVLLDQVVANQLPQDRYPSLGIPLPSSDTKSNAQSVRKYKANTTNDRWTNKTAQLNGGRILAFVAGGISYGELRDGYEVIGKDSREVVIGGTHFVTPNQYLDDITALDE